VQRLLTEVALDDPQMTQDLRRPGAHLLRANERNEKLIDDLLVLAEADRSLPGTVPLRPDELADAAIGSHQDIASRHGVALHGRLTQAVPLHRDTRGVDRGPDGPRLWLGQPAYFLPRRPGFGEGLRHQVPGQRPVSRADHYDPQGVTRGRGVELGELALVLCSSSAERLPRSARPTSAPPRKLGHRKPALPSTLYRIARESLRRPPGQLIRRHITDMLIHRLSGGLEALFRRIGAALPAHFAERRTKRAGRNVIPGVTW
jgi:hypothetical protein